MFSHNRLFSPVLALLSGLYWIGLVVDRTLRSRQAKKLPVPVISIGNITVGGTGKTPLLLMLLQNLVKMGVRPAVLTRGYKGVGKRTQSKIYASGRDGVSADGISDELNLLMGVPVHFPIGVGSNRARMANKILSENPVDVFILDDGFQHWGLKRDMDIVCLDGTDPFGAGHLLPWGRLREPKSALSRADLVLITRSELLEEDKIDALKRAIKKFNPKSPILTSWFRYEVVCVDQKEPHPIETFRGKKLLALSAIGNPNAFETLLKKHGADVIPMRFMDHHRYTESELNNIFKLAEQNNAHIVTTEKDWVKLKDLQTHRATDHGKSISVLKQALMLNDEDIPLWSSILKRWCGDKNNMHKGFSEKNNGEVAGCSSCCDH